MTEKDPKTGFARGFAVLSIESHHSCNHHQSCSILLTCSHGRLRAAQTYFGNEEGDKAVRSAAPAAEGKAFFFRRRVGAMLGCGDGWVRRRWMRRRALGEPSTLQPPLVAACVHEGGLQEGALQPPLVAACAQEAARGADSAAEELWLAIRSMPSAAAALLTVREDVKGAAGPEACARLERARDELSHTKVHVALCEAESRFRQRDGPLPGSISSCAALLLVLSAIVPHAQLHKSLPRTASWIIDAEPLLAKREEADGFGTDLADDVFCSRRALAEMCHPTSTPVPSSEPPQQGQAQDAPHLV